MLGLAVAHIVSNGAVDDPHCGHILCPPITVPVPKYIPVLHEPQISKFDRRSATACCRHMLQLGVLRTPLLLQRGECFLQIL